MDRQSQPQDTQHVQIKQQNDDLETDSDLPRTHYAKWKEENTRLQAENHNVMAEKAKLEQEVEYVNNAYDGLKHKHTELQKKNDVVTNDLASERNVSYVRWQENRALQERAYKAEKESSALKADLNRLRQSVGDSIRQLDEKYGALPEQD